MLKKYAEFINEANIPEKTFWDKLPGGDTRYEKKLEAYYNKEIMNFAKQLKNCKSMVDLFNLSKEIAEYGFQYPISGMLVNGATPSTATLKDIKWMDADREGTTSVDDLVKFYEKSNNRTEIESLEDTYIISWKWWCANIIRVLFFWKAPFDKNIDRERLTNLINHYVPKYIKK